MNSNLMIITTFCTVLSSFPIVYFSFSRLRKRKYWDNGVTLLLSVLYTAIWLACLLRQLGVLPVRDDALNTKVLLEVATGIIDPSQLSLVVWTCGAAVVIMNMIIAWAVYKVGLHGLVWRYTGVCIAVILVLFACVTLFICSINGLSFWAVFFDLSCGVMATGAYALGLTYKEFCVVGNIYLQGLLLVSSAFASLFVMIRKIRLKITLARCTMLIISLSYSLFFLYMFYLVFQHYDMPLENAFNLCVRELNAFGYSCNNIGYVGANIVIFVIGWSVILIINALFARLLNKCFR